MKQILRLVTLCVSVGLALVSVAQTITATTFSGNAVCPGSTIDVTFSTGGTFNGDNAFTVQIANGAGAFTNVPTAPPSRTGATTTVTATIPEGTAASTNYRVRVVSSSPAAQGAASGTSLTVRPLPSAPTLAAQLVGTNTHRYSFCLNDTPLALSDLAGPIPENYQMLYGAGGSVARTGQETTTAPVINTNAPSTGTYNFRFQVIDAAKGCAVPDREGYVAFLQTEVKARPDAAFVPNTTLTYCQGSQVPALRADATAPGASLRWLDGTDKIISEGEAPTPSTAQVGVQLYKVTQLLNSCEGPKTTITVSVQNAPAPTVAQSRLEYCKGVTAPALAATGTNLRWTLPNNLTQTAAPTPVTLEPSKTADGDVYYVTQTLANGCVSPRTGIRVVVIGPPTAALGGSTTLTTGGTAMLALTFTGNGPYQFKLSNGVAGTATKDTTIRVSPTATTVYQITEVGNRCGAGLPTSSATITIVVPSVRTLPLSNSIVCGGGAITASFQAIGAFNTGNTFRLAIAPTGSTTANYTALPNSAVGVGQITATVPATLAAGTYQLAVLSSAPDLSGTNNFTATTITVRSPASATLTATPNPALAGDQVRISVALGGDGPWAFVYRDSTDVLGPQQTINTNANPHLIDLRPARTTTYRLLSLSNGCGNAPVLPAPLIITVTPVLATEPLGTLVDVYPIPATNALTVRINQALSAPATLELFDASGRPTHRQEATQVMTTLPLDKQPVGTYLLRVRVGDQTTTRRVLIE